MKIYTKDQTDENSYYCDIKEVRKLLRKIRGWSAIPVYTKRDIDEALDDINKFLIKE